MTHTKPTYIFKHSLSCHCGEFWLVLADKHDFIFQVEKAMIFIARSMHRLYECELNTLKLTRGDNNDNAEDECR